jgi:hypothetical protein
MGFRKGTSNTVRDGDYKGGKGKMKVEAGGSSWLSQSCLYDRLLCFWGIELREFHKNWGHSGPFDAAFADFEKTIAGSLRLPASHAKCDGCQLHGG